jgi:dihydroorotase
MPSELFRHVRVLDPVSHTDRRADVWIEDGMIRAVADEIGQVPENTEVCDRSHLILGPGLVDLYSSSGEPGFESRETLGSLLKAAAVGGVTRLTLLPNTNPAVDRPAVLEQLRTKLQHLPLSPTQLHYWGALTLATKGEEMTELMELAGAGVIGFSDGRPLQNWALIRRVLEYSAPLQKPIALMCCQEGLAAQGVVREGKESIRLGLAGIPAIAESSALAALLECVEAIGTPVHVMRVSTAREVELLRMAKSKGLAITASTTWMHLLLNVTAVQSYDPNLRLTPPLGNPEDQAVLIQAVHEGVIDAIAIDHSPYTYEEKTVAFAEAPAGAIGLELALPLLWQGLVVSQQLPALTLWRALSTHPAQCLQQTPARVGAGEVAELILFDPETAWLVERQTLESRSNNTPWFGKKIQGRVIKCWGNGQINV